MERTDPDITNETATREQRRWQHLDLVHRMQVQAEALVRMYEALKPATDYAGVERAAKTAVAVRRAVDVLMSDAPPEKAGDSDPDQQKDDPMYDDTDLDPARPPRDAIDAWRALLDRKLDRLATARGAKTMAAELGPLYPDKADDGLGDLGAQGADAA